MFKKEIIILYYGLKDKRTGIATKLPILLSVIYMLSPIDLVPDFIPVFGYLDDLIIVPLLLNLSIKMLPKEVLEESIAKSTHNLKKFQIFFIVMIILLIALLIGIGLFIRHLIISR